MLKKIRENWKIMRKDRHLCNLEELEIKLKKGKTFTNLFLIPIIILSIALFYYIFMEENIIIGIVMVLLLFFIIQFQLVFFMFASENDNNLKIFIALKQLNNKGEKNI